MNLVDQGNLSRGRGALRALPTSGGSRRWRRARRLGGALAVVACLANATAFAEPIGFASLNGGTTGGGATPIITVTNASQFRFAATQPGAANIHVRGSLDVGAVQVGSNKTIFGATPDSELIGSLQLSDANNVIIRNLTLSNPNGAGEGDTITLRRSTNVWIDHNNLTDAPDGVLDIVQQSDFVTVSYNKFYYTPDWASNNSHRFAMLIGNGDNVTEDAGKLRVTLHHNDWGQFVQERMPRVRYGDVHVFNNYFNTPGNNYAIRIAIASELLIENNSFENVDDPFEKFVTSGQPGLASASGNLFVNTSGSMDAGDDVFTPPYAYTLDDAVDVKSIVQSRAGVFLPGDFNNDGMVDAADYTVWRDNLGSDESAINFAGDGLNGVDSRDFLLWRGNFGDTPTGTPFALPVPEPGTLLLLFAAVPAVLTQRRRVSRTRASAVVLAASLLLSASAQAQIPVFPGAEGYGGVFSGTAPAAGWFSNATVYHVTNLNDSGIGSLRGAFQENSSNKIIVFDVAGTIQLTSDDLNIKNLANYYIAGQTAPGPVTIYGDTAQLTHSSGKENRNVVLRYLSFRKGTGNGSDSLTFAGSGLGTNLILDHVSASWSEDEILSVANNNTNVTVQYSMINDALVSNHAYGSLIRPRISSEVTFHHNLYANNASRQARFGTYNGETLTADFRNNVVYNFRDRASYTGGSSEDDQEQTDVNFVGNYIIAGPGTEGSPDIAYSVDKNVDTRVYQSGNYIDPDEAPGGAAADGVLDGADTGWNMFRINNQTDQTLTQMATPFNTPAVTTQTAPDAYNQVRDYVGNWWWSRDAIDSRVIGNLTDFTGVPIGASGPISGELNGVLSAPQLSHPAGYDSDGDAMSDDWEIAHGLNPQSPNDWNQDFDSDGYINLIEFINEKGEFPAPAPIVFNGAANQRYANILNWKTNDGGASDGTNWQPSRFDTAVIHSGTVTVDSVGQHAGILNIAPDASDDAQVNINGGWLMVDQKVNVGSSSGQGVLTLTPSGTLLAPLTSVTGLGELNGSGQIVGDLINAGKVSPGASIGLIQVDGDYDEEFNGRQVIELESPASFDKLHVSGEASLAGELEIVLLNGFSPDLGDQFEILTAAGGVTGAFSTAASELPSLGSGLAWDIGYGGNGVTLAVVSAGLPGDYNNDGIVDSADYTVWRDGDSPDSTQAGYQVWRNNYGATSSTAVKSLTSVPEPSAVAMLALAAIGFAERSRRKTHSRVAAASRLLREGEAS